MGPRARARGNNVSNEEGIGVKMLQWGHERALVEMDRTTAEAYSSAALQWGHERALVEITYLMKKESVLKCFNGATSARSWKWTVQQQKLIALLRFNGE